MDYLKRLFNLDGKSAVVIGAGGHLCGQMARSLAKAGVRVVAADRNLKNAGLTAKGIQEDGGESSALAADVSKKSDLEVLLKYALDKYGDVDVLINGAGINAPTPFFDISLEEWNSIIEVHTTGTMLACQIFGKYMVSKKKGSIINMSSASSGPPLSKAFTYSAAKAGIKNLTQNLAREWAPYNVRVNSLKPGFFPTEWSMKNFIDKEREKAIFDHTPMGRYGRPEELSGAVLWLASDAAGFVTGAEITVDGGFTAMTI